MLESPRCRICEEERPGRTIAVLLPGQRSEGFGLCEICWNLLESGLRRTAPDGAPEPFLDGLTVPLTEPQVLALIEIGLAADSDIAVTSETRRGLGRRRLVRGELRQIDADLEEAVAASARGDWAAALVAVRMIQGRAVITRRALEGMLGAYPVHGDLPPLVRAIQAVGQIVSDSEVDTLAPHELRARMRDVLQVLDRELQTFLEPPEEAPIPADDDRDTLPGGISAPERL
jgi:hypothetical protein